MYVETTLIPMLNSASTYAGIGADGISTGIWQNPVLDYVDLLAVALNLKSVALLFNPTKSPRYRQFKHVYNAITQIASENGVKVVLINKNTLYQYVAYKNEARESAMRLIKGLSLGFRLTPYSMGKLLMYPEKAIRGLYIKLKREGDIIRHSSYHRRLERRLNRRITFTYHNVPNCHAY
jgi:hypothetical protein